MTSVSTYGTALEQAERLKKMQAQLATLQMQLSSGKKTTRFDGLGMDTIISQRARAKINAFTTYSNNIDTADRRIKLMMNSLNEVAAQTKNVSEAIEIQLQKGEFEMDSVGELAGKVRSIVQDLLNEQDGERYLFGGTQTLEKPMTAAGTMDTYLKVQLQKWIDGTITTDQMMQTYQDRAQLNDTVAGYSASLAGGDTKNVTIRVADHTDIEYTVLANDDSIRNIIAACGMLENIAQTLDKVARDDGDPGSTVTAPGATAQDQADNFYKIFNDIGRTLNASLDGIDKLNYKLSEAQARISQVKASNKEESSVLQGAVDDVENVDPNEIAVKLNALSIQLQASYQVTAMTSQLSLVNFLSS